MRLVIDSSVLIDHLRGGEASSILFNRIEEQNAQLFIPTIVIFELFAGKSSAREKVVVKITNLIKDFKRIELTEEVALRAGKLYRETGKHISPQDYIIAASALEIGGVVVTLNKKHFEKIPGLNLYPV